MKITAVHPQTASRDAAASRRKAKAIVLLFLLLSVFLSACSGITLSITSVGNKSTIEAKDAEDGKFLESSAFSVGKGKTVVVESALEKGQLKIEFARATVFRDDEVEQTIVEDVVAGETMGPGDSREFPLEQGDYVIQVTVIGSTSGKVTVNIK